MGENVVVTAAAPARGARSWSPARANVYAGGAAALSILVGAAAYFDAWTYVNNTSGYSSIGPWQDVGLVLSWLALTVWLGFPVAAAIAGGRRWVGWLLSFLVIPPARRVDARWPSVAARPWPAHHSEITPDEVRVALEQLGRPQALAQGPLGSLPFLTDGGRAGDDLRELLIDIVREKAGSRDPRDAEAGKILLEYYVKRSGTHEQVMERLHMSRQTYYRRLAQRAWPMVAERLDELRDYSLTHPAESPV